MTPQEAKKMLKAKLECLKRETSGTDIDCNYRNCDECNLCYEQGNMGEQKEALEMAIKALEQQPCETIHGSTYGGVSWGGTYKPQQPCEDCISREDAINLVHDLAQPCDDRYDWDISADEMIDGIKDLPSVTPKALEQINCLTGRPCEVCEFHSDNGCSRWKCVFEEDTK